MRKLREVFTMLKYTKAYKLVSKAKSFWQFPVTLHLHLEKHKPARP